LSYKIQMHTVFVSSHFSSLKKQRSELIDCLLDARMFPDCMEHFTVVDFEAIKRHIDLSDIVILMLGDEYGSCDENGISWTQREYMYATEQKKPCYILKTQKYIALLSRSEDELNEAQKKQIAFCNGVSQLTQTVTKANTLQKIVTQIASETAINKLKGFERWNEAALRQWQDENRVFDFRGRWYHVHLKDKEKETDDNQKYLRIGYLDIQQEFTPDEYTLLYFSADNFNVAKYDRETQKITLDTDKKTHWHGPYTLNPKENTIFGGYRTKRFFKESYGEWEVEKGEYMGIHDLTVHDDDSDGCLRDKTTAFSGNFNDVKPSPKMGVAYFFRTEEARNKFVIERFFQNEN